MKCDAYYKQIHSILGGILDETFLSTYAPDIYKANAFIADFSTWMEILDERDECVLYKSAIKEMTLSLMSLVSGNYRQSFMSLRFVLETSLFGLQLSANQLDLEMWKQKKKDVVWSNIVNSDTGVLSQCFCEAFLDNSQHISSSLKNQSCDAYRCCSEYIHGNFHTLENMQVEFSEESIRQWISLFEKIKSVISIILIVRYNKILKRENLATLEGAIIDDAGFVESIRKLIQPRLSEADHG